MPDTKAYKLRDAPEPIGAPRLLNAAAWLEKLAPYNPDPKVYHHNRTGEDNAASFRRPLKGF